MSKSTGPRRSPRKQERSRIAAPAALEKPAPKVPDNATPKTPERIDTSNISRVPGSPFYKFTDGPTKNKEGRAKRKRGEKKTEKESNSDSDSSEPRKRQSKKAKKSRIPETSEEPSSSSSSEDPEISPPTPPNESPRTRHRRIQMDIGLERTGSKETKVRLSNRMNALFKPVTLKSGRKVARRNPKKPFKAKRKKPENGASITNHALGKMLKAIRIKDRQYAGKMLRYFFNGFGYQLRLAEAERKMQELTLPDLKPNKIIKANPKKGKPVRLKVDQRRRQAHVVNRQLKRGLDALDQHLLPDLGAFPVIEQSQITQVDLTASTSDEEANKAAHPHKWMGREIPNPPEDTAKDLICLLNFLMPPSQLGNQPGDADRFDAKGNLLIVKEEPPVPSSEEIEPESDEVEIVEVTTKPNPESPEYVPEARKEPKEKGDRNTEPEKNEEEELVPEEPVPSTLRGINRFVPEDPANLSKLRSVKKDTKLNQFFC